MPLDFDDPQRTIRAAAAGNRSADSGKRAVSVLIQRKLGGLPQRVAG